MSDDHIGRVRAQPIRLDDPIVGECGLWRGAVQVGDLRAVPPTPLLDILVWAGVQAARVSWRSERRKSAGSCCDHVQQRA